MLDSSLYECFWKLTREILLIIFCVTWFKDTQLHAGYKHKVLVAVPKYFNLVKVTTLFLANSWRVLSSENTKGYRK